MSALTRTCITVLVIFTLLFALQNMEVVSVSLLIWEFTLPRSLILGCTLLIGVIIGLLINARKRQLFK